MAMGYGTWMSPLLQLSTVWPDLYLYPVTQSRQCWDYREVSVFHDPNRRISSNVSCLCPLSRPTPQFILMEMAASLFNAFSPYQLSPLIAGLERCLVNSM